MKYVVLLIVLLVVIGIWRNRRDSDGNSDTTSRPQKPSPRTPLAGPQDIVACAHCGMHIPQAEALMLGTQTYCCPEHRQQGPA
ncbi:MAG: hypothetical protein EOO29_40225 [Comamonadaceae bacterium]|nr:MAG: hypothetical protein EOO29_40225 [Comamonadaceae bacterium]